MMPNCFPPAVLDEFNFLSRHASSRVTGWSRCLCRNMSPSKILTPLVFFVSAVRGQGGGAAQRAEGVAGQTHSSGPVS